MPDEETNSLNTRIERLEREVLDLQRRIELLTGLEPEKIPRFAPNSPAPPRVEIPPKRAETPVAAAISPELLPMTTPIPAPAAPPPPSRTHEEWETLIGGKLLNRIGALALILGMGFFLKYAFDNQWISETVRVLIGGFIGTLLIAGAWRFHRRGLPIFAQGLLGAGISILYLSVYAAFNFYHLVTLPVAFVLMSMVTGAALVQALRCNSLAVTLLGWCGGFLTPFLLASGEPNEAGLFTYLILLDLGLLGVLFRRPRWALLEPLTLLATYLIYFLSYSSSFRQADPFLTLFFLAGFWGLFFALDLVLILRPAASLPELRRLIHALNAGLFSLGLYDLIAPNFPAWTGAAFLALGAVYFLSHLETRRRLDPGGTAPARQALAAAALLVFATSVQFSGRLLVAAWSLEAAALVWYGVYRGPAAVWKTGLAL